jgi:ribosomal protein S27E
MRHPKTSLPAIIYSSGMLYNPSELVMYSAYGAPFPPDEAEDNEEGIVLPAFIKLKCPDCLREMENAYRVATDPPAATVLVISCPDCNYTVGRPHYLDEDGRELEYKSEWELRGYETSNNI